MGVASATVAARLGLECHVFMGEDVRRQAQRISNEASREGGVRDIGIED